MTWKFEFIKHLMFIKECLSCLETLCVFLNMSGLYQTQ